MQDVIETGTGRIARINGVSVAGKTGTAENYGIIYGRRQKLDDHSWFVCFAPVENPKIAVAVIVENGGFGATWAGPMAGLIMEQYLKDSLSVTRLKEVERIEQEEIIIPVVKQKRNRLDSLRREKMKKVIMRATAMSGKNSDRRQQGEIPFTHLVAIKSEYEEQFI
jgi:penicillin-binding protein 2